MPDALKALLASTDTLAAKAQGAVLSATRDIRKEILYLAGELDIAGSADAREAVFAKVTKRVVRLGHRLAALEQAAAAQAQDAAGAATEDELGKLVRISGRRAREIVQTVTQRGGGGMAATMTQAMNENIVTALREATVSAFREQAVAGMTAKDLERVILDKWRAAAKDPKNLQFIDRSGKVWDTQTYINMNVRTNAMHVYNETLMQDIANTTGGDLVMVSTGGDPNCALCFPWEARILSITGRTKGFPTYDEALAAGLFHPNCVHTLEPVDEDLDADEIELQRGHQPPANATRTELDDQRYDIDIAREMAKGLDATQAKVAVDRKNLADSMRHGLIIENADAIVGAMTDEQVNELCPNGNPPRFLPAKYNGGEDGWNKGARGGVVYLHRADPTVDKLLAATKITTGKPLAPYSAKITPPRARTTDTNKDTPETPEAHLARLTAEMRGFSDDFFAKWMNYEETAQGLIDEIAAYVRKVGDIGNGLMTYAQGKKRDGSWVLTHVGQYASIGKMLDEFQAVADGIYQSRDALGELSAQLTEAVSADDGTLDAAAVAKIRNKITVANGKLNKAASELAKKGDELRRGISGKTTQAENLAAQGRAVIDALVAQEDGITEMQRPTPESLGIDVQAVRAMPLADALAATTHLNDGMERAKVIFDKAEREATAEYKAKVDEVTAKFKAKTEAVRQMRRDMWWGTGDDADKCDAAAKFIRDNGLEKDFAKSIKKAKESLWTADDESDEKYRIYHNKRIYTDYIERLFKREVKAEAKEKQKLLTQRRQRMADAEIIMSYKDPNGGCDVPTASVMDSKRERWEIAKRILDRVMSADVCPTRGVVVQSTSSRAFQRGGTINLTGDDDVGVYIHEYSHFVEANNDHVHKRCQEFLRMRAERSGTTTTESLRALTGIRYDADEVTLKDDFFSPYCGKVYGRNTNGWTVSGSGEEVRASGAGYDVEATELLSMGLQRIYENPVHFYENDREYFDFCMNLIQGRL